MFFGLIETKAEKTQKELEKLQAEVAAKEAVEGKKEVTFQDLRVVVTQYGKKVLAKAEVAGSELVTKVEATVKEKATVNEDRVIETFNEKSGKVLKTVFKISKALVNLAKNKAVDKLNQ